jgi:hypothetical protein
MPSQQLATKATAKDQYFKAFWLRHDPLRVRPSWSKG